MTKIVFTALALILCVLPMQAQKVKMTTLKPADFKSRIEQTAKPFIIDVRSAADYKAEHISGAVNLDSNDSRFIQEIKNHRAPSDTLFVYCKMGKTSKAAANKMVKEGFLYVYNLKGGMLAWSKKYP